MVVGPCCRYRARSPHHLSHPNREVRQRWKSGLFRSYEKAPSEAQHCIDFLLAQAAVHKDFQASRAVREVIRVVKQKLVDLSGFFAAGLKFVACFAKQSFVRFRFEWNNEPLLVQVDLTDLQLA